MNELLRLVNIKSLVNEFSTVTTLTIQEQIDEYGFVIMSEELRKERHRRLQRSGYMYGIGGSVGKDSGGQCKGLCRYLPHKKSGRTISLQKTGDYWCSKCGCVMKCSRCHCCGRIGRSKPHRPTKRLNHPNTKFVD